MVQKHDIIHKTGQHMVTPSEEDRATATDNMYKKFGMFSQVVYKLHMQTD